MKRLLALPILVLLVATCQDSGQVTGPASGPAPDPVDPSGMSIMPSVVPGPATPMPPGLIHWWPADGNSPTDVIGGADLTASGGATYTADGVAAEAFDVVQGNTTPYEFFKHVPASGPLYANADFTIDFWVLLQRENPSTNVTNFASPFASSDGSDNGTFQIEKHDGAIYRLDVYEGGDVIVDIGPIDEGQWRHLAMTYEASTQTVTTYHQGAQADSHVFGTPLDIDIVKLGVNRGNSRAFPGHIDELHIFDRVLSASEIQAIFNAQGNLQLPSPEQSLLHYWPADGASSADVIGAADLTSNSGAGFVAGLDGDAFDVSGSGYFKTSVFSAITGDFTLDFWFNPDSPTYSNFSSIFASDDSNGLSPGGFQVEFSNWSTPGDAYIVDVRDGVDRAVFIGDPFINAWKHVALTYNAATQTVTSYLDGQEGLAPGGGTATNPRTLGTAMRIDLVKLGINRGGSRPWSGLVDEVHIFDRVLNAAEIQDIFNAGGTWGPPVGPQGPSATPVGVGVEVTPDDETTGQPSPVGLTFDNVTGSGETTVTSSEVGQGGGPPPPRNFRLGSPPSSFNVETTATFTGSVEICIDYSGVSYGNESKLKLLHFDDVSGDWVDVTTSQDTVNDNICGSVISFSPFLVAESNVAPVVTAVTLPGDPVLVNDGVSITASFSDENPGDVHTASIDWGDGAITTGVVTQATGSVAGSHAYPVAGVYTVTVTVSEDMDPGFDLFGSRSSAEETTNTFLVAYDPSGGFVTGGGWIDSPAGAYIEAPSLTGKANFGFVSKYKKGATVPTGNTEFQFKAGDLNFHSSSYDFLVITMGGTNAQYKGSGTINGMGDYRFMLWAGDDSPDTFRIRIWTEDQAGVETDVYDNGFGQPIGGGSIVIHTKK